MADDSRLTRAIKETKEYLEIAWDPSDDEDNGPTDEDAMDSLLDECGQTREGYCTLAGTEHCDWECPFS
jgi:hypothetical protein